MTDDGAPARRNAGSDAGFTLIEMLVTVVVLAIIALPLAQVLLAYLRNTDATSARMSESHDAQISSAFFAQDVQAVGVRGDFTTTAEPALVQSIETGVAAGGGLYPCGTGGTPAAVVRFAWDDYSGPAASNRTQTRVAYVVDGPELHRILCDGSGAVLADVTIAHDLVSPSATVACADAAGSPTSCTSSTVPETVSLVLTIQDPESGSSSPYEVTLTGQRRQT
jgi:prepilin-type N-terminal cleavage/methylation domain-containing protein